MAAPTSSATPPPPLPSISRGYYTPAEQILAREHRIYDAGHRTSFNVAKQADATVAALFKIGNLSHAKTYLREREFEQVRIRFALIKVSMDSGLQKILGLELFSQGVEFSKSVEDPAIRDLCLLTCMRKLTLADPNDPKPQECLAAFTDLNLRREAMRWYEAAKAAHLQKLTERADLPPLEL